jgi:hypothetical protein
MTPSRRRPFALLAAAAFLTGLVVAAVLALALPSTRDAVAVAGGGDPLATTVAPPPDLSRPATAPARPEPTDLGVLRLRATAPPRIEASAPDTRGGPRWVVRTFQARRFVAPRGGGALQQIGRPEVCAQLGRELDGRFGWIDATNTWRPVGVTYFGAPISCKRRRADPTLQIATPISDPSRGSAEPLNAVVWGFAGAPARVALTVDGRARPVIPTPRGVVLDVLPPGSRRHVARAGFRTRDGRRETVELAPFSEQRQVVSTGGIGDRARPRFRPGAPQLVDFRLPDPAGGLPWGIAVIRNDDGSGWCRSGLGQIVGERVGWVDEALGTFADAGQGVDCIWIGEGTHPTRRRPLEVAYGYAAGGALMAPPGSSTTPSPGRVMRRTLEGRFDVTGLAHPDVVSITIATPRDVRTITPSRRAHVFAAIYDGDFPAGSIEVSARMRDGTVYRAPPHTVF